MSYDVEDLLCIQGTRDRYYDAARRAEDRGEGTEAAVLLEQGDVYAAWFVEALEDFNQEGGA